MGDASITSFLKSHQGKRYSDVLLLLGINLWFSLDLDYLGVLGSLGMCLGVMDPILGQVGLKRSHLWGGIIGVECY